MHERIADHRRFEIFPGHVNASTGTMPHLWFPQKAADKARDDLDGKIIVKALSTKVESFRFHHARSQAA